MIEIRYSEDYELADLVGKSLAEAREQYQAVFDIPDKAVAKLNGKKVKKNLEPKMMLNEGDELSFEVKKGSKKPLLVGALILALALTGGLFAYTYTTATATITPGTSGSDWAQVAENQTITWTGVSGEFRGSVGTGPLFEITGDNLTASDFVVDVYLTNAADLVDSYRYLNMQLQISDTDAGGASSDWAENSLDYMLLTLHNGHVSFTVSPGGASDTHWVYLSGGSYRTNRWGWGTPGADLDPEFYCEIGQK